MRTDYVKSTEFMPGVYFTVERIGQESPHLSDHVMVKLAIHLPPNGPASHSILEALRFGQRVKILGQPLDHGWGTRDKDDIVESKTFVATTWLKAFETACDAGDDEIGKLVKAVKARAKALADAEEETEK